MRFKSTQILFLAIARQNISCTRESLQPQSYESLFIVSGKVYVRRYRDQMTQMVKNLLAVQEIGVWFLGWKNPLEKGMATDSSILPWRTPQTEARSLGLQSVGYNWVTNTFPFTLGTKGFPCSWVGKESACSVGHLGSICDGQEDPLEKEMATNSSILAWRIQWTEQPGRLLSTGSWRLGHDLAIKPPPP